MLKKTLTLLTVGVIYFVQAQDVSVLRNAAEVYSSSSVNGTAKYNAMAGAMGALGGDVSTLSVNPAGIGVAIMSDLSISLSRDQFKNTATLYGNAFDYSEKSSNMGQAGGIAVFKINGNTPWKFLNIGFNYTNRNLNNYVESRDQSGNTIIDMTATESLTFNRHAYDRTGSLSRTNIGVGANYDNKIYVGAGLNVHTAHLNQKDLAEMTLTSTDPALNGVSDFFHKQYTPFYEEATGVSASFGVIGKVNNDFRLGAAIETPSWWTIDRSYTYYDQNDDLQYIESRKFTSPTKATLSAAYVPNKSFAVNLDYTLGLSKPKFSGLADDAQKEMDNFFSNNYRNTSEIKLGAEYRIKQFRVRGGYAYASNPFDQMTLSAFTNTGATSDFSSAKWITGARNTIGFGLGYDFKTFYIDAAYNNISSSYSNPFLRGSAASSTGYYSKDFFFTNNNAVVSEVKKSLNSLTLTFGWKF